MVGGEGVAGVGHVCWSLPTWTQVTVHGTPCLDGLGSALLLGRRVVGAALAVWAHPGVGCPAFDVGVDVASWAGAEFAAIQAWP